MSSSDDVPVAGGSTTLRLAARQRLSAGHFELPILGCVDEGNTGLAGKLQGKVVSINAQGHAVTDIAVERLQGVPTDERVTILCDGHTTSCIFPADHTEPEMTFMALKSREGFLVLTIVGESVQTFLGIRPGCEVTVKW